MLRQTLYKKKKILRLQKYIFWRVKKYSLAKPLYDSFLLAQWVVNLTFLRLKDGRTFFIAFFLLLFLWGVFHSVNMLNKHI